MKEDEMCKKVGNMNFYTENLGDLDIDGTIILQWILNKNSMQACGMD
jgi:hypothetical protein